MSTDDYEAEERAAMEQESEVAAQPVVEPTPPKRRHRATYATDKRKGGYLIRVVGPDAARFVGRTIPVTTRANAEHQETLSKLVWAGTDRDTGNPVALYGFESKPRGDVDSVAF